MSSRIGAEAAHGSEPRRQGEEVRAAGGKRQPLSAVDLAWWRMERPANPMTITAVLTFAEPLTRVRLAEVLEREFLTRERFTQRVVDRRVGRAYWEPVEGFSVGDQVFATALPEGAAPLL